MIAEHVGTGWATSNAWHYLARPSHSDPDKSIAQHPTVDAMHVLVLLALAQVDDLAPDIDRYERGWATIDQVAAMIGVSSSTAGKYLRAIGERWSWAMVRKVGRRRQYRIATHVLTSIERGSR